MKTETTERKSNFELLRIFAMFLIVLHHFNVHGIFKTVDCPTVLLKINYFLSCLFATGGKIGVILFVLLTGYFLIDKPLSCSSAIFRVLKIYVPTWFYSILLLVVSYLYGLHNTPSHIFNVSLFPFCAFAYWFITTYIMLCLFSPFINNMIKNSMNEKRFLLFSSTLLLFFIPTFFNIGYGFCCFVYFLYYYILGAFIKLESFKFLNNNKKIKFYALISILFIFIFILSNFNHSTVNLWKTFKFSGINSLLILIISVYIFNYFKDLKIPYNKFINYISSSMFGVYLIHDNCIVRPFLWKRLFQAYTYINSKFFILDMFLISAIVFILCIIIDKILSIFYKKGIDFIIHCFEKIIAKFEKKEPA